MQDSRSAKILGVNLGLRFYLVLLAIFIPTFVVYYFYSIRTIQAIHAGEIEDVIRMNSFRVEDWLLPYASLPEMSEADRARLGHELRRIAEEPTGIESATVFWADSASTLQYLAGYGVYAPRNPNQEDVRSLTRGEPVRIDVRRDVDLMAASVPLRYENGVRGVLHMTIHPEKIGLGRRIPDLRLSLIVGASGVMLVFGISVAGFFHYAVRRPIDKLTQAMERASEGNLSALVDIRTGEFGWLAASYNQMMRRLKSSMDENRSLIEQVRGFNEELKGKIEAATHELAGKNTQLETANEKLFMLQRQLTTLEKLATLGQIATLIAHELGTPLNAISGHLQLLLQEQVSDPRVSDRLKVIDGQVDRLTGIVRGVLKVMRVPPPRIAKVDVRAVIREVTDLFGLVADKRQVQIDLKLAEVPPIEADADQLQQVFMNLFTNAMDAMKNGGRLTVSVGVVPQPGGGLGRGPAVRVEVADTGGGMDEETALHAFEPFYTTTRPEAAPGFGAGIGLGLSICRQIVKNHRGEISVRSERGKGTTFTLYLPLEPAKVVS